ncbi:MAG: trypsin-like peptidase domain-containing protein, partial [Chloroflexi bacterium]|nr:trypsin-like peptidase domain-containing protein [Chloroflexota bacterium]
MAITEKNATGLPIRLTDDFAAVAERLCRSTVQVRGRRHGGGSGVIWHSSGLIITNAHVVQGSRARVELSDRRVFDATVTARSLYDDLAALKVEADNL